MSGNGGLRSGRALAKMLIHGILACPRHSKASNRRGNSIALYQASDRASISKSPSTSLLFPEQERNPQTRMGRTIVKHLPRVKLMSPLQWKYQ